MRILAFLAACLLASGLCAGSALAQQPGKRGDGFKAPGHFTPEERRRTGDSAREEDRRDAPRQERMRPEEREKLRRDIEDANRRMERRR